MQIGIKLTLCTVGVGFSQGTPNITNEVELGQELLGFYRSFVDTFQVHNRKVYLTGESYGGYYGMRQFQFGIWSHLLTQ